MAETAHPLVMRAREALARSEIKSAEAAIEERLKTAGRDINALEVRYQIQRHRGQLGEAARTLDTVIGINSRADWAYNELIQLLMAHGKVSDAEQVTRAALRANPGNAQAHDIFGVIISDLGDLPAGEWHFRRALEILEPQGLKEPHAALLTHLAGNLARQGRIKEAESCLERALQLAPNDFKTLTAFAAFCEGRNDLTRARELLDRAAASSPGADVTLPRAKLLAHYGRYQEALGVIDSVKELSGEGQLTRGKILERLERYDEAWQDFVAAKRKLASEAGGLQYKADAVEALYGRFKQFFTRENFNRLPRAKPRPEVPQPIFIMGLPRSGTTLLEQIIASHSRVIRGGELAFLGELRKLAGDLLPAQTAFPDNLAQSWTADRHYAATVFRDYYLARAERYGLLAEGKTHFTDKMPFNEIYLPLLKMAFPRAKIIHVMRHPLDVCISVLSNPVTQGFNSGFRLEDTAHHLAAVFDLSEHYRRELDLEDYVLKYEDLVSDPSGQIRKVLAYLELPFEEACLKTRIEDGSIKRHAHYAQHLKPCLGRLRPMMTAYGYN
jgi:tetratricopeptide (TPR) repeat protein